MVDACRREMVIRVLEFLPRDHRERIRQIRRAREREQPARALRAVPDLAAQAQPVGRLRRQILRAQTCRPVILFGLRERQRADRISVRRVVQPDAALEQRAERPRSPELQPVVQSQHRRDLAAIRARHLI